MHIVILADFSAAKSRGAENLNSLAGRRCYEINRDNFDEVFSKMNVKLQLPIAEKALTFNELDNLHPDFLYERISVFEKLRALKYKLKSNDNFDSAAQEIYAWANYKTRLNTEEGAIGNHSITKSTSAAPCINHAESFDTSQQETLTRDSLLDAALQGYDIANSIHRGPLGVIDNLIKDIVAPFVETKIDPRQPQLLNAINLATNQTMRAIMHHSEFQQLEASWRSVYWLIRRMQSTNTLRVFLMDVSLAEARADLALPQSQSQLFKHLVENKQTIGDTPFGLIVGDYHLTSNAKDAKLAGAMAALAYQAKTCWISGGHPQLAGHTRFDNDPDTWLGEVDLSWQHIRQLDYANHLALAAPRFLLRLPFGAKTSTIDNFSYEELTQLNHHEFYLWGNGAYLVASLLVQSFTNRGWALQPGDHIDVAELVTHIYQDDGESVQTPCAEILLNDRASQALSNAGLLVLRSVKNQDRIIVNNFCSIKSDNSPIKGQW